MVDERAEAVRPYHRVDPPVTQARCIIATQMEPAVVEHESLDADPRRPVGELFQQAQVMVEIDCLPDVQRHGHPASDDWAWAASHWWNAAAIPSRPSRGAHHEHPGRLVGLAGFGGSPRRAAGVHRRRWWCPSRRCVPAGAGVATPGDVQRQESATGRTRIRLHRSPASWRRRARVRPCRPSRNQSPSVIGRRCGYRSRSCRPVKSRTSS